MNGRLDSGLIQRCLWHKRLLDHCFELRLRLRLADQIDLVFLGGRVINLVTFSHSDGLLLILFAITIAEEIRDEVVIALCLLELLRRLLETRHGLNIALVSDDRHHWPIKERVKLRDCLFELLCDFFERLSWAHVVLSCEDLECDNNGTLVDLHDFDVCFVDAQNRSEPISKLANSLLLEELSDVPLKSDCQHDGISGVDIDCASRLDPELQEVLDPDEAVLSATVAHGYCIRLDVVVPVSRRHQVFLLVIDLVGSSIGVVDGDKGAGDARLCMVGELLFLRGCSSVLYRVVARGVEQSRELLLPLLTCVGPIPRVIHESIESVIESAFLVLNINGLRIPVHAIVV